jgi:hypothetical protein
VNKKQFQPSLTAKIGEFLFEVATTDREDFYE